MYEYAKMALLACEENQTIVYRNKSAFDEAYASENKCYYMGVKDTYVLQPFVEDLKELNFIVHTIDKKSEHNRGVDNNLINPLTNRFMTGSSSATAINIFKNINHLGVGTDGGGSILGPALALNLFGLIAKEFPVIKNTKKSTDLIEFTPSAGIITKDFILVNMISDHYFSKNINPFEMVKIFSNQENQNELDKLGFNFTNSIKLDHNDKRKNLLDLFKELDNKIYVFYEQGIDLNGYGDSLINEYTTSIGHGNKGLIRIVNMLECTAVVIPGDRLSSGILLFSKTHSLELIKIAQTIKVSKKPVIDNYYNVNKKIDKPYIG